MFASMLLVDTGIAVSEASGIACNIQSYACLFWFYVLRSMDGEFDAIIVNFLLICPIIWVLYFSLSFVNLMVLWMKFLIWNCFSIL